MDDRETKRRIAELERERDDAQGAERFALKRAEKIEMEARRLADQLTEERERHRATLVVGLGVADELRETERLLEHSDNEKDILGYEVETAVEAEKQAQAERNEAEDRFLASFVVGLGLADDLRITEEMLATAYDAAKVKRAAEERIRDLLGAFIWESTESATVRVTGDAAAARERLAELQAPEDVGEGWRLLRDDEVPLEGDELDTVDTRGQWRPEVNTAFILGKRTVREVLAAGHNAALGVRYRRRLNALAEARAKAERLEAALNGTLIVECTPAAPFEPRPPRPLPAPSTGDHVRRYVEAMAGALDPKPKPVVHFVPALWVPEGT